MTNPILTPGAVVHFIGRTRRFVVARVDVGTSGLLLTLVALSGAPSGSVPSSVKIARVEIDVDQNVAFSGPCAARFRARYDAR